MEFIILFNTSFLFIFTATVCLGFVVFFMYSPGKKSSFYCGDLSIYKKYQRSTIPTIYLVYYALVMFFVIWIIEALHYTVNSKKLFRRVWISCIQSLLWYRELIIMIAVHLFVLTMIKVYYILFVINIIIIITHF